jgi:thiol-disulfide isomerase/thioredoxin
MKAVRLAFLALVTCAGAARSATPAGWSTNLLDTFQTAGRQKQPVLLYFTAAWCSPCKQMARTTLQDATVLKQLDQFARAVVDVDADPSSARQHHVAAMPTFLILSADGEEVSLSTGYMDAPKFLRWLTNGLAAHAAALDRQKQFLARQHALKAMLDSPEATNHARAAAELFELCNAREPAQSRFAAEQLRTLARRSPLLLLDGLNHPKLATRIHVANVLRDTLGEGFVFDPWAPAPARTRTAAEWAQRLRPAQPRP